MSMLTGKNNITHYSGITAEARVAISTHRTFHGKDVSISVRTKLIKDDTAAEIKVLKKNDKSEIVTIAGQNISDSKLDHEYTIDWKGKDLENEKEFLINVIIDEKLEVESAPLYVDMEPPLFSA